MPGPRKGSRDLLPPPAFGAGHPGARLLPGLKGTMRLELSRHTIHNYVKALHQRFGVSSRGELLARVGKEKASFTPKLSMELPREKEKERQASEQD